MSVSQISALVAPPVPPHSSLDLPRRSANFHPNIWGDHFIQYISEPLWIKKMEEQIIILKEKVRMMLVPAKEKALRPLIVANLIDLIQRLGLHYHFECEIEEVLQQIYNNYVENGIITLNEDLHSLSLLFRLLRQQGYHISSVTYMHLKDEQGNFKESMTKDVEGMLSLYEASHLRIHGEDILDEVLAFTSLHLNLMSTKLSPSLSAKVKNSLNRPLRKNLQRLMARHYISAYEEELFHDENLLLFAKLDFNMLQKQHQKELGNISKWWKGLDFESKLPFARNRIVEVYFWMTGLCFEPHYSLGRKLMTKVISLTSIIDDIYDVYGTFEELQLFTEAVERWDISCMDFLPEYMKCCYKAILDTYEEIEQEMAKEGRSFCMKRVVQAYFAEAKWFKYNYTPTLEEYMSVAQVSSAYISLMSMTFVGMGSIATEKVFQWLSNRPKIVNASTLLCRLMDDIVSSEFEKERGHVASALDCYMKQHGVTKQETIDEFQRQVISAWKDINEECLHPTKVSKPLLERVLNMSRAMDVLYKDGDGYTHSKGSTKKNIVALFLNPCPV
ncbi:putative lyase [Lupinus albus]|uniref:Putative lyase n=1 Tax=Lupinus albus TaxID=3870 RepID=A0A6A4NYI3_LUPAL|nr:putative lyase [Lupinus albus]